MKDAQIISVLTEFGFNLSNSDTKIIKMAERIVKLQILLDENFCRKLELLEKLADTEHALEVCKGEINAWRDTCWELRDKMDQIYEFKKLK